MSKSEKWQLPDNILKRRSVIFFQYNKTPSLKHKLRAVNPHFPIVENIKLSVPGSYWFEGAYRVYDPYEDEERFIRTINNFVKVCGIDKYLFVDNGFVYEVRPETDTKTVIDNMKIIDDDAHAVGNIMLIALGSVVNACPELKEIIDIGYKK
ncbi:MAG: hypothetical protein K2J40_06135 [Ruminococcus sp.]|nr:hypothetical protein [Ruminococcus sp.]